jgi:protein SCO1/2
MNRVGAVRRREILTAAGSIGLLSLLLFTAMFRKTAAIAHAPNQAHAENVRVRSTQGAAMRPSQPRISTKSETARDASEAIETKLREFDGRTDHHTIAACLTEIRRMGPEAHLLEPALLRFMPYQANIYQGRIKPEVMRLRAYVLLTLADTGSAKSAFPFVCEYVNNLTDYGLAFEAGAGARAAAELGPAGSNLLDALVALFYREFSEPEFSLDRYSLDFPSLEATTARLEIIKAFQRIGFRNNPRVEKLLQTCANSSNPKFVSDPRIAEAASRVLLDKSNPGETVDQLLQVEVNRTGMNLLGKLQVNYVDQDGRQGILADLIDRPTVVVFFYTRCTNGQKCSNVVSQVAQLQQMLRDRNASSNVRLIGITYEPKSDDSVKLKNYGLGRNVHFDNTTFFLRLDPDQHVKLISDLDVPVSYSDGWVNTHGITLFLISERQHVIARYESVSWENEKILADLLKMVQNQ